MSVATLFNAYCTEHEDCEDLPAIQEALNLFGENLRYNCRANSEEHRDLVWTYRQTSNISLTLMGNKIVDHSDVVENEDVVGAPVGAAPTTYSFST